MIRLLMLVEGQSDEIFVKKTLTPYLASHEFEAWLFCSPDIVSEHFGNPSLVNKVRDVVERAGEPEFINQGVKTHPKARLLEFNTGYKETSDGPILIEKIGIPTIKTCCPHFAGWLQRLEALGNSTEYH